MINKIDVIIIGNGIIGNAICYSILELDPTIKIAMIGDHNRAGGATVASGAMLNCFAELTSLSLKTNAGKAKFDLALSSLRMWENWLAGINNRLSGKGNQMSIKPGTFVVHNTRSGRLDTINYNAIIDALDSSNEPYERIDPTSIPGFNPVDDSRSLEGLYLENEGSIDSRGVLDAFTAIFANHPNINLIDDTAINISEDKGSFIIKTKKGEILYADKAIVAAGAYSQVLIDGLPKIAKRMPRIFAGTGHSLIMEQNRANPIDHVIRSPNRSGACGLHALPTSNDNIYIGASNNVFVNPQELPAAGLAHFLLECTLEQINQDLHSSRIIRWHTGNRPASLDTYPLIGETSIPGLWIASGTYRDGFHMSPLIGGHIARKVLGMDGLINHDIFAPERKLLPIMTKEEAIDEAVEHYMSGAYERAMKLPKAGWDPLLRELFKRRLEILFADLGTEFGLTPDMLMMFEFESNRSELISKMRNLL